MSRLEFHHSVLEVLQKELITQIEIANVDETKASKKKLQELLDRCFPLAILPTVRPIVLAVLRSIPKLPQQYLKAILDDKSLYGDCPVEAKRQIWDQLDSELFAAEISPIFSAFLDSNQNSLINQLDSAKSVYFMESTKSRRQSPHVQQLAKMIGKNSKLYDSVLQILRLRFFDQKSAHFGSLRGELLMALHDAECTELLQLDPCHKYAWCLDACLKEYQLNVKQCKELEIVLDGVRRGQDTVMADLALISADPRTMHLFGHLCTRMLQQCVEKEQQPRDNQGIYCRVCKRLRTQGGHSIYLWYGPRYKHSLLVF